MKIAIVGAGKWGSALYNALSEKNSCVITSRTPRNIPNFVSIDEALDCEMIVLVIAAQQTASWLETNFINKNQKILVASKGIDAKSGKFLNEIFEKHINRENLAYLSGPSFASEVIQKLPCAVVINSTNDSVASEFANLFPDYMKTYTSNDVIGAEVCGAYKNVIAIASGICDGLKLGNNARASLIARGLVEITRFGKFFGAQDETFIGLSGVGDLFLTASSELSRNYRVGLGLAQGKSKSEILSELGEVAEGVFTAEAIVNIAKTHQIYTPIANEVFAILNGKNVKISLSDLLRKK